MPQRFKHYWPLSEEDKKDVWENGIIILDANVLLHIYRLPEAQRNDLLMILKSPEVLDRLWIPHQAALEFHRNRLKVISDQISTSKKFLDTVDKSLNKLFEYINKVIREHHPLIDREHWKKEFNEKTSALKKEYEDAKGNYPISITDDPLLPEINEIMEGRIGEPLSEAEMIELRKEAKERFAKKIPPGYMDEKNKDEERAWGDLILWKQILKQAKEKNSHIIFVLDDMKEDWWLKIQGHHLPRPELREEFNKTAGKEIDFCSSERFLGWANMQIEDKIENHAFFALVRAIREKISVKDYLQELKESLDASRQRRRELSLPDDKLTSHIKAAEMAEWFLENYEDPAQGVPYDSGEGGYQYIFGGPYDPYDVLFDNFPDASEEEIEKAISIINRFGGYEWVRKGEY